MTKNGTGEVRRGKLILRLIFKDGAYAGVILPAGGGRIGPFHGATADEVWERLEREAGKTSRSYFGFDGARTRFLHFFPNGFQDRGYTKDERAYKKRLRPDSTYPRRLSEP